MRSRGASRQGVRTSLQLAANDKSTVVDHTFVPSGVLGLTSLLLAQGDLPLSTADSDENATSNIWLLELPILSSNLDVQSGAFEVFHYLTEGCHEYRTAIHTRCNVPQIHITETEVVAAEYCLVPVFRLQ